MKSINLQAYQGDFEILFVRVTELPSAIQLPPNVPRKPSPISSVLPERWQ
jgi:hypothetical protein